MPYVIKASRYPYIDKNGNPTFNIENAQHYTSLEMAELAADVCQGVVKESISIDKKIPEKKENISNFKEIEKNYYPKSNQSWMRGGI
ncbi:hypothetical protein ACYSNR_01070 [Enterococcus sp. LJL128]